MNSHRRFKNLIYEQLARIGKALASPKRLELLDLLCQAPRTVEALAKETSQSIANTSQHLKVLRMAGLVEAEKSGLFVTYRLADVEVGQFFRVLRVLAESHLSEIDRILRLYASGADGMEAIDREELMERAARGEIIVLDVRPVEEYDSGHIPGAISIPLSELESRLAELPPDSEIVAYCRGPYCLFAVEAVERLRARGFRASRLEEGVFDWRARGLAIEARS
jgi:rhodanese-related sulfurtransferase